MQDLTGVVFTRTATANKDLEKWTGWILAVI